MKKEIIDMVEALDERKTEIVYYFLLGLTRE